MAARILARRGSSVSAPRGRKRAALEHAQELGLELRRHLCDLVEKQRPRARELKLPADAAFGAGEGAALVAEDESTRSAFQAMRSS